MKDSLLPVLVYLLRHDLLADSLLDADQPSLQSALVDAGFDAVQVRRALEWLDVARAGAARPSATVGSGPVRIFAPEESELFELDAQGFLITLERCGVLDADLREQVIERALALGHVPVDLGDLRWVVLLVLHGTPRAASGAAWLALDLLDSSQTRH